MYDVEEKDKQWRVIQGSIHKILKMRRTLTDFRFINYPNK